MTKPRKWAELIKAWADGAQIEYRDISLNDYWWPCPDKPDWSEDKEYRIKPEREYSKSTLADNELAGILNKYIDYVVVKDIFMAGEIADAAIKKYIQENEE